MSKAFIDRSSFFFCVFCWLCQCRYSPQEGNAQYEEGYRLYKAEHFKRAAELLEQAADLGE